jgi:hypothetical protein
MLAHESVSVGIKHIKVFPWGAGRCENKSASLTDRKWEMIKLPDKSGYIPKNCRTRIKDASSFQEQVPGFLTCHPGYIAV